MSPVWTTPPDKCRVCGDPINSINRVWRHWVGPLGKKEYNHEALPPERPIGPGPVSEDVLASLPRLAQDYTPEQREACVAYLASLPLDELRQRQAIKNEEIERAFNNCPEEILISVQEQAEQLTAAVRRKMGWD